MTEEEHDAICEYWLCENKDGEQYVVKQTIWQTMPDNAVREISLDDFLLFRSAERRRDRERQEEMLDNMED